jgi:molybdenum cofactor sulfurtransferase
MHYRILQHFDTTPEEYTVVFTSGCTAALKLLAESFQFGDEAEFAYHYDNHTSVIGMREIVRAPSRCLDITSVDLASLSPNSLVAFPAQSNFNGTKYHSMCSKCLQAKGIFTLLDAAAYVSTARLNLHKLQPDFVELSFYKMFGFPTGLGAFHQHVWSSV